MYHFQNYWNLDLECKQDKQGTFEKQVPGATARWNDVRKVGLQETIQLSVIKIMIMIMVDDDDDGDDDDNNNGNNNGNGNQQRRTAANHPAECNEDNNNDNDNKQKCNQALKIFYDYKLIEIVS